jgi:uncharacterized protein YkwD
MHPGLRTAALVTVAASLCYAPAGASRGRKAQVSPAKSDTTGNVQATADELKFVELANRERAKRNLSQLSVDPLLILIAREHSLEMMEKNYFNHYSPTSGMKTPMDRYLKGLGHRPAYAVVGENLFYCSMVDVDRGHQAFMRSKEHRENLLFPQFDKIGVGIHRNNKGEFWVTQMFLTNDPTGPQASRG